MPLHPHELIRRWQLHVLPKGLPRIRPYGFLSPAAGRTRLKVRAMLGEFSVPVPQLPALEPFACPHRGGELTFLRPAARVPMKPTAPRRPPASGSHRPPRPGNVRPRRTPVHRQPVAIRASGGKRPLPRNPVVPCLPPAQRPRHPPTRRPPRYHLSRPARHWF
jgi:hypothetical protein